MSIAQVDEKTIADALAYQMPRGRPFEAGHNNECVLRKFLNGLASAIKSHDDDIVEYSDNTYFCSAAEYIDRWERDLGLPDGCFGGKTTLAERQLDVVCKILSRGISTFADVQKIAEKYGVTVTQRKNSLTEINTFSLTFPHTFTSVKTNRFTIIYGVSDTNVSNIFPMTFPINFAGPKEIIRCLLRIVTPLQYKILFEDQI